MRFFGVFLLCGVLSACASAGPKPVAKAPPAPDAYIILFQGRVTEVNARAAALLNNVAARANAHPDQLVDVAGPPVTRSFRYDPRLAVQRIQEVEHELEAAGVDKERIIRTVLQNANVRADGTGAQRVEIHLITKPAKETKPSKRRKPRVAGQQKPSQLAELTPY